MASAAVPEPVPIPTKREWASEPGVSSDLNLKNDFLGVVAAGVLGTKLGLGKGTSQEVAEVMDILHLQQNEIAVLMGTTPNSIAQWSETGVPSEHVSKFSTIFKISHLLQEQLKPGKPAEVVRRRAPIYNGGTMLDVMASDQHEWLLYRLVRLFDYSTTA